MKVLGIILEDFLECILKQWTELSKSTHFEVCLNKRNCFFCIIFCIINIIIIFYLSLFLHILVLDVLNLK